MFQMMALSFSGARGRRVAVARDVGTSKCLRPHSDLTLIVVQLASAHMLVFGPNTLRFLRFDWENSKVGTKPCLDGHPLTCSYLSHGCASPSSAMAERSTSPATMSRR